MQFSGKNDEFFEVTRITHDNSEIIKTSPKNQLSLLWFVSDNNLLKIDEKPISFNNNDFIFLTEFHKIEIQDFKSARLLRFNKSFYCILDHDSEVGCKGILYYGASNTPIIHPSKKDLDVLNTVWKMLCLEMEARDNLQLEMLQMMLKRILILCTRIYKSQANFDHLENKEAEIVREFNFLVEQHFKEKHYVADYAALLNKAPKTLANHFKKIGNKTPSQFIHDRIIIEAKRLISYTEKPISEIGYELGFADIQTFSRFFKKLKGISPTQYRQLNS